MGSTSCVSKQFWSMDRRCLSIKIFVNVSLYRSLHWSEMDSRFLVHVQILTFAVIVKL